LYLIWGEGIREQVIREQGMVRVEVFKVLGDLSMWVFVSSTQRHKETKVTKGGKRMDYRL